MSLLFLFWSSKLVPNQKYIPPFKIPNTGISVDEKFDMVVKQVFEFSGYHESNMNQSYPLSIKKNTLATSSGKTQCWVTPALVSEGLTVVFTPLKALIDDQIKELIIVGIQCAGLYTVHLLVTHPIIKKKYLVRSQLVFCMFYL